MGDTLFPMTPDKEEWSQYATRLRYFFVANNIKEEAAQKAVFLTVVGPATFKTLTSLVSPASVDDKTYPQLMGELGKYYNPMPSEIVQRFKFNSRCRQPTESVATFVTELRALVKHCNYAADSLDSLLRDRLVCGINDMQMQLRLLSEEKLKFETAFKITLAMETAARDTQTCSALQQEQPQVKEENLKLQKIMPAQVRAAPIVPVLKSDKKSLRICGDFKMTVNSASKLDAYPIPRIEDLFARLSGGVCFSKLDLSQAYLQLELEEDSKQFVVINTHKGLFRYNRLPFGISSAPGIFQRTMESLLQNIPSVVVYLDDILIAGQSEEEHLRLLEEVLETAGLRLKREKCVLMSESVEYLGHTIDRHGLHPTKEKVQAVCEAPSPKNVSELKSYLGLLTYYSKFLPNLATLLAPLYQLLQSGVQWKWSAEQDKAFKASKELLVSSQVLVHFDSELPLVVACDASPYGLEAVLSHKYANGSERPIGYASRSLSSAERNYSQLEREGLACVFGVKRFHSYLYGHSFSLITDHKPLEGLFHEDRAIPAQASSRIQRWALTLAMYDYHLIHKKGSEHANADAFSRLPLPVTLDTTPQPPEVILLMEQMRNSPVNTDHIRTWTRRDTTLSQVVQFVRYGWPTHLNDSSLQSYWQKRTELSLQEECLLWGNRVVIPQIGQERVLQELHEAHPGATRMKQLARTLVWWPGIDQDIEKAVKSCPECQFHLSSPAEAPLLPWTWPSRPWSRVHIDFMGPFQGHMVLVLVDAHSKWIEAHVMSAITSTLTIQCLRRIFATFWLPEVIVTDNGPSLVSEEFEAWLKRNGIRHKTSPPYHPATNGLAERAVQTVKRGVKKMKSGTLSDVDQHSTPKLSDVGKDAQDHAFKNSEIFDVAASFVCCFQVII